MEEMAENFFIFNHILCCESRHGQVVDALACIEKHI